MQRKLYQIFLLELKKEFEEENDKLAKGAELKKVEQ